MNNKTVSSIRNDKEKVDFYALRNKHVTAKNNPSIKEWELETPKDIRAGAIRDIVKGYKTALTNIKKGNITHFKLRYAKKKNDKSLEIPASAIKYTDNKLFIYKTYIPEAIKISKDKKYLHNLKFEYDCRLSCENGNWYLNVPVKHTTKIVKPKYYTCALDPGIRKFQTIYSDEMVVKIELNKENLKKLHFKLDLLRSLRDRKLLKKKSFSRREIRTNRKLKNMVDDLHWKTISFLTKNFRTIFLPKFENQEIAKKMSFSSVNRKLYILKHYKFFERLKYKCTYTENCWIRPCTEEFTTIACTKCGSHNKIGSSEIYTCSNCSLIIDRDINGGRNIYIKNLKESF